VLRIVESDSARTLPLSLFFVAALIARISTSMSDPTPLNSYGDPNAIDANGLLIQQRTCEINLTTQYYTFIPLGYVLLNAGEPEWYCPNCITYGATGYFIQNKSNGLCMDARDGATSDWSVVQQWTCRNKEARGTSLRTPRCGSPT